MTLITRHPAFSAKAGTAIHGANVGGRGRRDAAAPAGAIDYERV